MILITIVFVTLAFPAGYILLGIIAGWLTLGAVILLILITVQYPLYRLLAGVKKTEKKTQ